ncbi:hypothetical protein SDRG_02849 [Saprolegnia diclina VS20]|uniref:Uncharacterized protein n=1 Tax=Saprolegnia diclina (strain VS20) TaxID=1156394 RepID=T0QZR6_SAPDV|nr:hypothetical protein SDRG_02849 [Saprolegnia diclina VS20]EQC40201.1 hypothetical protein SDRG_02849 [Saprolegnia diclina VS20]|eukprot:XP_008606675.1 hypothetical protein SDRG_02849 [Saprolegnia diclina VS20]
MDAKTECQYSYKPCSNPRTTKRNGAPHLLCEYHRKKANAIQRVYAQKKRLQKQAASASHRHSTQPPGTEYAMQSTHTRHHIAMPQYLEPSYHNRANVQFDPRGGGVSMALPRLMYPPVADNGFGYLTALLRDDLRGEKSPHHHHSTHHGRLP